MENNNNYAWNKTLKFSWGHIIAFVALIFISYVTYMGDFYQNGGDFKSAAIKVCLIDISLLITFIGAQIYKGADEHFDRSIIIERILIVFCPVAFVWAMIPFNHFWTVFAEREQIGNQFNISIEKSRQMFVNYDQYANDRIDTYGNTLDNIIRNKVQDKATYIRAGFQGTNDDIVKNNYIETLKLQLLSENTDSLRQSAMEWIDKASQDASVWNAFLVGNVENISDAIKGWNEKLNDVSKPVLSNENIDGNNVVLPFDDEKESYKTANGGLAALRKIYTDTHGLSMNTVWSGLILFLMILFPYFLQKRNEKAKGYYSLIPVNQQSITGNKKIKGTNKNAKSDDESELTVNSDNDDIYGGTF